MRIVLAPDTFRGSLTAEDVCVAMEKGVRAAVPGADVIALPMADGGEGTLDCLLRSWGGTSVAATVTGPMGGQVPARYGLSRDRMTAVVELAIASGFGALSGAPDPLLTSTRGTGELIARAVADGAREVIVCLGGSVTNDGGAGLFSALGVRFLDAAGDPLPDGGGALTRLAAVDTANVSAAIRGTRVRLACDVTNPLVGPLGAAAVFGPQKGADESAVELLDRGHRRLADVLARHTGRDVAHLPGAGAAGGTAGGLVALLDARIEPGAHVVASAAGLPGALTGADLVLTGEGRLDQQTVAGKVVSAVATLARATGVPAIAVAGSVHGPLTALHDAGLTAAFCLADGPRALEELLAGAPALVAATTEQVLRLHLHARSPR